MRTPLRILLIIFFQLTAATACIWDADSLSHEKSRSHDLAQTILGIPEPSEDTNKLQTRIDDGSGMSETPVAELRLKQREAFGVRPARRRFYSASIPLPSKSGSKLPHS